jgi:hypothetical protein
MKRFFNVIMGIDVAMLLLPTCWMGPQAEFWIAATLAAATAVLWVGLKVPSDE